MGEKQHDVVKGDVSHNGPARSKGGKTNHPPVVIRWVALVVLFRCPFLGPIKDNLSNGIVELEGKGLWVVMSYIQRRTNWLKFAFRSA